jgi:phage repressor protein C with HTH and peptisase S24 domain
LASVGRADAGADATPSRIRASRRSLLEAGTVRRRLSKVAGTAGREAITRHHDAPSRRLAAGAAFRRATTEKRDLSNVDCEQMLHNHDAYYAHTHILVKRIKYAYIGIVMQTIAHRIKAIRSRLAENQTAFGRRFGVDQSTVSKWEHGTQMPGPRTLDHLAVIEEETLGDAHSSPESGAQSLFTQVPVSGEIGAGAKVYDIEGGGSRIIDFERAPRGFGAVEALRVRGDSMYPVYRDGDLVFIEDRPAEFPLHRNTEYVIELSDGRRLLKMVEPAPDGRYNLVAYNAPIEPDVEIINAQRVRYVRKA